MIIKGYIELHVINKDTREVERVVEQENTITLALLDRLVTQAKSNLSVNTWIGQDIILSADSNESVSDFWWVQAPVFGYTPAGVTSPLVVAAAGPAPVHMRITRRFDPPAVTTTRTISTIGVTYATVADVTGKVLVHAYVKLTTPVIQTDTQLVDVVYRLQWVRDSTTNPGIALGDTRAIQSQVQAFKDGVGATANVNGTLHSSFPIPYTPASGTQLNTIMAGISEYQTTNPAYSSASNVVVTDAVTATVGKPYPLFKRVYQAAGNTSATVGQIIASEAYVTSANFAHSWRNVIQPNGSDIQPVYSHAAETFVSAAPNPFMDSFPATGTGTLTLSGSWTNPNYPELYLIKMAGSGAVGASTYQFWKRNHTGFSGVTYRPRHVPLIPVSTKPFPDAPDTNTLYPPIVGGHGLIDHPAADIYNATYNQRGIYAAAYSYHQIVTSDDTGITLYDIPHHTFKHYDATTTPALPVTGARQVSVNKATGDIWVACVNTGLWKIDVVGNTITHITVATHGVPGDMAYGVDIGRSNSIWAAFEGGLASSFDNGATWTVYSPTTTPAFVFTGITDSNWNTISYIKVDPSHLDDRMIIVRRPKITVLQTIAFVWWSRGTATSVGAVSSGTGATNSARLSSLLIDVSDTDGFWVMSGDVYSTSYKLNYGSPTSTAFGTTPMYTRMVGFEKGPSGEDCCVIVIGSNYLYTVTLYNVSLTQSVPTFTPMTSAEQAMVSATNTRFIYLGKGMTCCIGVGSSPYTTSITHLALGIISDTANSLTGPMSYLMWDKYGWDGSAWVLNHPGSKITHSAPDLLLNGINVAFQDGATGTSFVSGDYYTAGVFKGLWKTNSIAYTTNCPYYYVTTKESTDFDGVVRLCPSVGTVTWKLKSTQITINPDNSLTNKSATRPYGIFAVSNNRVFGDFSVTGTVSPTPTPFAYIIGLSGVAGGVGPDVTTSYWVSSPNTVQTLNFVLSNNAFQPYVNGTAAGTSTTITVANTTWEIRRVGPTITFYVGGVLKHTLTDPGVYSYLIRAMYSQSDTAVNSQSFVTIPAVTVASSGAGYYVQVGSSLNNTGIYDPTFLAVDASSTAMPTLNISLNGTPVTTKYGNSPTTVPAAGEASIFGGDGVILFNAADAGKTVTGKYVYTTK